MERRIIAEEWNDLAVKILPLDYPRTQYKEMRRVFYAGAQSVLVRVLSHFITDEDDESTIQMIEDIRHELEYFGKMIEQGRA